MTNKPRYSGVVGPATLERAELIAAAMNINEGTPTPERTWTAEDVLQVAIVCGLDGLEKLYANTLRAHASDSGWISGSMKAEADGGKP